MTRAPRIDYERLKPGPLRAAVDHALAKDTQMKGQEATVIEFYANEADAVLLGRAASRMGVVDAESEDLT